MEFSNDARTAMIVSVVVLFGAAKTSNLAVRVLVVEVFGCV